MRRWPFRARAAVAMLLVLIAGCRSESRPTGTPAPSRPRLPEGGAGRLLPRAIGAHGGWERWRAVLDVSFIGTQSVVDAARGVSADSLGWFMAPLHDRALARMDSIGLPTEMRFGIDADRELAPDAPAPGPAGRDLTRRSGVAAPAVRLVHAR